MFHNLENMLELPNCHEVFTKEQQRHKADVKLFIKDSQNLNAPTSHDLLLLRLSFAVSFEHDMLSLTCVF